MVRSVQALIAALVLVLCAGATRAQSGDDTARARTHFEAGRALYNLGNYTDAIREFSAGYQLAPRPQFLVNLGQAYRKLGDLKKAREMYKKFLDEAPQNDPDREQVGQIIAELDQQIAAAPPPVTPTQTAAAPAHVEVAVQASAPPPQKPWIKRNWWIIPVGAVVVGAALGVGLYFGLQTHQVDCSQASLGCIDTTMR
jgi:tetratricopeptide (TPR) repeat protein